MIISHKHKFIFVKTTKTAGTSIEIALSEFLGPEDVITPIISADEKTRAEFGFRGPQNYKVRLSRYGALDWLRVLKNRRRIKYFHHIPAQRIKRYVGKKVWDEYSVFCFERNPYDKAVSRYFWDMAGFKKSVPMDDYFAAVSPTLLSNWHLYTGNGKLIVDFVGRFENLKEDLEFIRNRIGLPHPLELPRAKGQVRKEKKDYRDLLSDQSRAVVEKVCEREIEMFSYTY